MKHIFKEAARPYLPTSILDRQDKMGFPTPLTEWVKGEARDFVRDIFSSAAAKSRPLVNNRKVLQALDREPQFGRKVWGLLCLELWQQTFHDRELEYKRVVRRERVEA
jgi:asparagine synthase (glutamine-hydrolysing)